MTDGRRAETAPQNPWQGPRRRQPQWVTPRGRVTDALIRARPGMGVPPPVRVKRCPSVGGLSRTHAQPETPHTRSTRGRPAAGRGRGPRVPSRRATDAVGDQNPGRRFAFQDFGSHAPGPCQQGSPRGRKPERAHEGAVQQGAHQRPGGFPRRHAASGYARTTTRGTEAASRPLTSHPALSGHLGRDVEFSAPTPIHKHRLQEEAHTSELVRSATTAPLRLCVAATRVAFGLAFRGPTRPHCRCAPATYHVRHEGLVPTKLRV